MSPILGPLRLIPLIVLLSTAAHADPIQDVALHLCKLEEKASALFDAKLFPAGARKKIGGIFEKFKNQYGDCQKVVPKGSNRLEYVYEKAVIPGKLYLNNDGKIAGIWFDAPIRKDDSLKDIVADFKKLSGKVALTVRKEGGKDLLGLNGSLPLAVGSTFKLYILKALKERIDADFMRWTDVIDLRDGMKSLPSGILQDWPSGSPLTVHTLTTLMISKSDNTATDILLFTLGRREVERHAGARNRPFLSTLESFQLKSKGAEKIAERYAKANEEGRRKILSEISRMGRKELQPHASPYRVGEIEWFYTTNELCDAILDLRDLELLSVNPGVAPRGKFKRVVYKGGSEAGVINMTHALQHKKTGEWICVSASWNNTKEHLSQDRFVALLVRILHLLSK